MQRTAVYARFGSEAQISSGKTYEQFESDFKKKPTAAIYARYSTDDQRPTSVEDQVRNCRQKAEELGFTVDDSRVFADMAISGGEKGSAKRLAFRSLLDAIKAREVDVLFVDEVSRVARNELDGAKLSHLVDTTGLRVVVVSDGIDSQATDNWKMMWSLKLMMAVHQNQSTAKEVTRAMIGQLERGYMIAQTPIGYRSERIGTKKGKDGGVRWLIDEGSANIVREVYAWRHQGMSLLKIATKLNAQGVACPGARRCKGDTYWRPATVARVLANTIYRGVFVWNGSAFTRAKARRKRQEVHAKVYLREELRLVTDEVWEACNPSAGQNKFRGGGKYALSGVVRCGHCNAALSFSGGPKVVGGCCAQCVQAKAVNQSKSLIGYTTLKAVTLALEWGIQQLFTQAAREEFKERLRARLTKGPQAELASLELRVRDTQASLDRMRRMLADPRMPEDWLKEQIAQAVKDRDEANIAHERLKTKASRIKREVVEAQVNADPFSYIETMLQGEPEPWKVRAALNRLISRFQFVEKGARGRSVFELEFKLGVLVAELTEGPVLDPTPVVFRIEVNKTPGQKTWEVVGSRI